MCIFFVAVNVRCACAIHSSSASKATRMTTTMEYMQSCPIVNRKSDIIKHPFSTITNQEIKNLSSNTVFLLNDISRKRSAIDVFIFQFLFSFGMCAWYPQPADTRTKLAASRSVSMQGSSDSDQSFFWFLLWPHKAKLALNISSFVMLPLIFCNVNDKEHQIQILSVETDKSVCYMFE